MDDYFQNIFNKFKFKEKEENVEILVDHLIPDQNPATISKKRKRQRMTVFELKQLVKKPHLVDWVDCTAKDPLLLIQLKSSRNTIPIPIHWSQKRKYLQNKRGVVKRIYNLPDYIKQTGFFTKDSANTKGKMDIDYQKLHDAFFKWQQKPDLTLYGDIYYEGKEFECKTKRKPGELSNELISALNMPALAAPPWLLGMQRYGPPPSYPLLKIPGLNAPIPMGAQWGYHPGGWGKPPVDEFNRPLYGDVFGTSQTKPLKDPAAVTERILWGEIIDDHESIYEPESDQESENGGEGEVEEEIVQPEQNYQIQQITEFSQEIPTIPFPTSFIQPDSIQLKKETKNIDKSLYTILNQKATTVTGFMGSQHGYEYNSSSSKGVEIAINPEELDSIDADGLKEKFMEASGPKLKLPKHEDLSDLVTEHIEKQKKPVKEQKPSKKKDSFKF